MPHAICTTIHRNESNIIAVALHFGLDIRHLRWVSQNALSAGDSELHEIPFNSEEICAQAVLGYNLDGLATRAGH
jgi:hypothetical protein